MLDSRGLDPFAVISLTARVGTELDKRLVEQWQAAGEDLGIRVTAPVNLIDETGSPFFCEALVHSFGSPKGAIVVSPKTERRVRKQLRSLAGTVWVSISQARQPSTYTRKHFVDELTDWGWFGAPDEEPDWYTR